VTPFQVGQLTYIVIHRTRIIHMSLAVSSPQSTKHYTLRFCEPVATATTPASPGA
jgi:hypothetical protein